MNTVLDLFRNLRNGLGCLGELFGYFLRFVSAFLQDRASLAAWLLAAESQVGMCRRRMEQKGSAKLKFTAGFRLLWVVLSKFWAPWHRPDQADLHADPGRTVSPVSAVGGVAAGGLIHVTPRVGDRSALLSGLFRFMAASCNEQSVARRRTRADADRRCLPAMGCQGPQGCGWGFSGDTPIYNDRLFLLRLNWLVPRRRSMVREVGQTGGRRIEGRVCGFRLAGRWSGGRQQGQSRLLLLAVPLHRYARP